MDTDMSASGKGVEYQTSAAWKMHILKYFTPEEYLESFAEVCPKVGGFDMVEMVKSYERSLDIGQAWLKGHKRATMDIMNRSLDLEDMFNHVGVVGTERLLNAPVLAMDIENVPAGIIQRMVVPTENARDVATAAVNGATGMVCAALLMQEHSVQKALDLLKNWLDTLTRMTRAGAATVH